MSATKFSKSTQALIDRIKTATEKGAARINREKAELGVLRHLEMLKQPSRPIRWHKNCFSAFRYFTADARAAARDAAWADARAAARAAARDAAWAAAMDAAWAAAWAAARDYARDDARAAARDDARAAAWAAAWDVNPYIPLLESYEAGLFSFWIGKNEIHLIEEPIMRFDERERLHSVNAPAIEWPDEKYFFWHGVRVPEKIIMTPNTITKEDITNEKNSEVSRAIAERLGWPEYMRRAETVLIDKWFDSENVLHYELWDFKKRFERTPRLLKMESPELKDGTKPLYIEPVDPHLNTCQGARRWQFKKTDGKWPTIEECNKNPELSFEVET
jgi:hypothetical protein